jgi:hypothetical protein
MGRWKGKLKGVDETYQSCFTIYINEHKITQKVDPKDPIPDLYSTKVLLRFPLTQFFHLSKKECLQEINEL